MVTPCALKESSTGFQRLCKNWNTKFLHKGPLKYASCENVCMLYSGLTDGNSMAQLDITFTPTCEDVSSTHWQDAFYAVFLMRKHKMCQPIPFVM